MSRRREPTRPAGSVSPELGTGGGPPTIAPPPILGPPSPGTHPNNSVELDSALTSILRSVLTAKEMMDAESANLVEVYGKSDILSNLPIPAFSISEVNLTLRFVVDKVVEQKVGDQVTWKLLVSIDSGTLARFPETAISQANFKVVPIGLRVYKADGKTIVQ